MEPATTRENFYVAMTRGREANRVYVVLDQTDEHADSHPEATPDATARTVLYGVLQHSGAELSAHETITAEQETWGSIAQLAAEYETIAAAAQHDRWATLIRQSGLTNEQAEEAFGPLTAELRRAEANHHNPEILLPRLVAAKGLEDADDVAAVLHHRVARTTARPAGSGRTRKPSRLIAGLVPAAEGPMDQEMRQALEERRDLIETRATTIPETTLQYGEPWVKQLGDPPKDERGQRQWHRVTRTVAAYRDRYQTTSSHPLGVEPETTAQKLDHARARTALHQAQRLTSPAQEHRRQAVDRSAADRSL
ncbi:hypothetical protein [Nesterenkonia populi]